MTRTIATLLAGPLLLAACGDNLDSPATSAHSALIIVDMQYDFLPGGSLPTSGGDEIIDTINALQPHFDLVVATQDWHPPDHGSFASAHPGHDIGDVIDLHGLPQILWPDHAVQESPGAELVAELDQSRIARVFRKGTNPAVDSYSGFFDNGQRGDTGLQAYLEGEGVTEVFVVGLALDYCVKYTALDARRIGLQTTVITDASRAVNFEPEDGPEAVKEMEAAGIRILQSAQVLAD
jgi:nicotinamidase/pyrazinamidase